MHDATNAIGVGITWDFGTNVIEGPRFGEAERF